MTNFSHYSFSYDFHKKVNIPRLPVWAYTEKCWLVGWWVGWWVGGLVGKSAKLVNAFSAKLSDRML